MDGLLLVNTAGKHDPAILSEPGFQPAAEFIGGIANDKDRAVRSDKRSQPIIQNPNPPPVKPADEPTGLTEKVRRDAASLRNQWTTTAAALAAAKKAADAGDFDAAIASSKEAEALARASIFQATSEKTRWKDLEIH